MTMAMTNDENYIDSDGDEDDFASTLPPPPLPAPLTTFSSFSPQLIDPYDSGYYTLDDIIRYQIKK